MARSMKKRTVTIINLILIWFSGLILFSCSRWNLEKSEIKDKCFIKGSQFQLKMLNQLSGESHGLKIQYQEGQLHSYFQVFGDEWSHFWKLAGFSFIHVGDKIIRVNNCSVKNIVEKLPSGATAYSPIANIGYISLVDILLIGPKEEIERNILEVEIERKGKILVLKPIDDLEATTTQMKSEQ
jgi:hypothetical protein